MALKDLVRAARSDNEALLELVDAFKPLLRKCASRLNEEDAYEDFVADFIELIRSGIKIELLKHDSDAVILGYIKKSMNNAFQKRLRLARSQYSEILFADMSEAELDYAMSAHSAWDEYFPNQMEKSNILSEYEFRILRGIYVEQVTVIEIAKKLSISRQAVNQTKNRALDKLRRLTNAA